jgi:hypothetical protein
MWFPSQDEAIEMFACHFEAWHRGGASAKAKETAASLSAKGDSKGFAAWRAIADRVEELRTEPRVSRRQEFESA